MVSETDWGEKHNNKLTESSSKAKSPDTISIHFGKGFGSAVISYVCFCRLFGVCTGGGYNGERIGEVAIFGKLQLHSLPIVDLFIYNLSQKHNDCQAELVEARCIVGHATSPFDKLRVTTH